MSVTLKSHLWAHLQLQTSAFLVALEQQLLVDGIIFSVGFIFIWMLIPWICFLQHLQEFLCCYSWIVLLQSVSWWKDKRCLLPLAQRHLPGPLSSVVLLYCGLSTSTTCLQAFVNSSKIIKQTCRGTRCLFFPAQVFADFPWCPLRHRLSRQVWQLRCLMHQILSVSLQWCEKLWKTWLASLSHSSHSCAFLTRIWLKQRQKGIVLHDARGQVAIKHNIKLASIASLDVWGRWTKLCLCKSRFVTSKCVDRAVNLSSVWLTLN